MTTVPDRFDPSLEEFLATVTTAAYGVALRHGIKGPFTDLELDLWRELRRVVPQALRVADSYRRPDVPAYSASVPA